MYIYLVAKDKYSDGQYIKSERILTHELKFNQVLFNQDCKEAESNGCKGVDEIASYLIYNKGYKNILYQGVYE